MHTQQRNRSERAANARLLAGVAQITRNRSGTFLFKPLLSFVILTWLQMSLEWPQPHRGREFSPSEARSRRRIEREMMELRGVFRALEQERHTLPRPRIIIENHRGSSLDRSREMREVLIFRALNESGQDFVRSCPCARRAEDVSPRRRLAGIAREDQSQPRTIATRMEAPWCVRIQELKGFSHRCSVSSVRSGRSHQEALLRKSLTRPGFEIALE